MHFFFNSIENKIHINNILTSAESILLSYVENSQAVQKQGFDNLYTRCVIFTIAIRVKFPRPVDKAVVVDTVLTRLIQNIIKKKASGESLN
jgi:hypothetical protein